MAKICLCWSLPTVDGSAFTPPRPNDIYYILDAITPANIDPSFFNNLRKVDFFAKTGSFALEYRHVASLLPACVSNKNIFKKIVFLSEAGFKRLQGILQARYDLEFKSDKHPAITIPPVITSDAQPPRVIHSTSSSIHSSHTSDVSREVTVMLDISSDTASANDTDCDKRAEVQCTSCHVLFHHHIV
jgi:hypothetical protein